MFIDIDHNPGTPVVFKRSGVVSGLKTTGVPGT